MSSKPTVDIVIPVLNEQAAIPVCIEALFEHLKMETRYDWRLVVVDNGSTDDTFQVTTDISKIISNVSCIKLSQRGRGRAIKTAWNKSNADVMVYMDVDLSTRLDALIPLVKSIYHGGADICVGSRLMKGSTVLGRTVGREITSRGYNLLIDLLFPNNNFSDAQCGFKAVSPKVVDKILPMIRDNEWFFDTELLLVSERNLVKIKEIPVHWTDDQDTRVKIIPTIWKDIKGLIRLRFTRQSRVL